MLYFRAAMRTAAAVLCLLLILRTNAVCAQTANTSAQSLERGAWQALMLTPGGELARADLEVGGEGSSTRAFMKWRSGLVQVTDLHLEGRILSFTWEPSFYLTCQLEREANRQFKGACLDSQNFVGPMVLSPPDVPIESDDIDLDKAFAIWNISRDEYMREHYAQPTTRVAFDEPPLLPARNVEIEGRRINVAAAGEGEVTVVLVSGTGDDHTVWHHAQLELSERTRTISYDRPGLGRSDDVAGLTTPSEMAEDLHVILRKSGEQAPYLLVGHGAASFIIRDFVDRYAEDVAGIVLIDPAHEKEDDVWRRLDAASWAEYVQHRRNFLAAVSPASAREFDGYLNALKAWDHRQQTDRPSVPAVVLASGRTAEAADWVGDTPEGRKAQEKLQHELAAALGAEFVNASSGSYVHLEDTGLVVDAVERVLESR